MAIGRGEVGPEKHEKCHVPYAVQLQALWNIRRGCSASQRVSVLCILKTRGSDAIQFSTNTSLAERLGLLVTARLDSCVAS